MGSSQLFGVFNFTGETGVLIKSPDVKGYPINSKMGTVVKDIRFVVEKKEKVAGKIEG